MVGFRSSFGETHVQLSIGSNCGIALADKPAFGLQCRSEASPAPIDNVDLFEKFIGSLA